MNAKQTDATVKVVMTGLMVAGAAVASLITTGCDNLSEMQIATMTSEFADDVAPFDFIQKPEPGNKIAFNHNETFLAGACDNE